MQPIVDKKSKLNKVQRFFIEKSNEMLHLGTIDSYRVRLHNPKTILEELLHCLIGFKRGQIKHFHTIKGKKDNYVLVDECITLLKNEVNYLSFGVISEQYLKNILLGLNENNYLKAISVLELLIEENKDYKQRILNGLEELLNANDQSFEALEKLDDSLNFLFSELINNGYSKSYLFKLVYGLFVNKSNRTEEFAKQFDLFKKKILKSDTLFNVVFRIETSGNIINALSEIASEKLQVKECVSNIKLKNRSPKDRREEELKKFNEPGNSRRFIHIAVKAKDYFTALKVAKSILSEYFDVINLGLSDEPFHIHNRVLVVDMENKIRGDFQTNVNLLDGKYKLTMAHYKELSQKIPGILANSNVLPETKDKIKSAIRYLRLGNQSTEVEHKFINYWIGLEYLFSSYQSENTINRIKEHFINAHSRVYVKRNCTALLASINKLSSEDRNKISSFTNSLDDFLNDNFYRQIEEHFNNDFVLIAYRVKKIENWFKVAEKSHGKELSYRTSNYTKRHRKNLESHFTRVYRLRNEIIHDAATNTNNEHITSNLRYYLTFILNEVIDFLHSSNADSSKVGIENYFILNEVEIGNIECCGNLLEDSLRINCSLSFIN